MFSIKRLVHVASALYERHNSTFFLTEITDKTFKSFYKGIASHNNSNVIEYLAKAIYKY